MRTIASAAISAVALAILLVAGALIYSAYESQRAYQVEASQAADYAADQAKIEMQRECVPLPFDREIRCKQEVAEAERENARKEYDLEAQRTTATWTAFMGAAALIGMAFSIIGVGLVWFTLRETRSSADASRVSADSARKQLRLMEMAQRAEVSVTPSALHQPTEIPGNVTSVIGAPPADEDLFALLRMSSDGPMRVRSKLAYYGWAVTAVVPDGDPRYDFECEYAPEKPFTIAAPIRVKIRITPEQAPLLETREQHLWLWVRAEFEDILAQEHVVGALFRWDWQTLDFWAANALPGEDARKGYGHWVEIKSDPRYYFHRFPKPASES